MKSEEMVNAENKASSVLKSNGLFSYPINIVKLVHDHYKFLILETLLPKNTTGMMAADDLFVLGTTSNRVIVVTTNLGNERLRFVIAHELAHYIHNTDENGILKKPVFFRDYDNNESAEEKEADILARCLLMPEELVREVSKGPKVSVELIAEKFWVSHKQARKRILDLGMEPIESKT